MRHNEGFFGIRRRSELGEVITEHRSEITVHFQGDALLVLCVLGLDRERAIAIRKLEITATEGGYLIPAQSGVIGHRIDHAAIRCGHIQQAKELVMRERATIPNLPPSRIHLVNRGQRIGSETANLDQPVEEPAHVAQILVERLCRPVEGSTAPPDEGIRGDVRDAFPAALSDQHTHVELAYPAVMGTSTTDSHIGHPIAYEAIQRHGGSFNLEAGRGDGVFLQLSLFDDIGQLLLGDLLVSHPERDFDILCGTRGSIPSRVGFCLDPNALDNPRTLKNMLFHGIMR